MFGKLTDDVSTRTEVKFMQSYLLLGAPVVFNDVRYNDPMDRQVE